MGNKCSPMASQQFRGSTALSNERRLRGPLVVLVILSAVYPLRLLFESFWLGFVIEPTAEALYREGVAQFQAVVALIALAIMASGLLCIWRLSTARLWVASMLPMVAIILGLGVTAFGHIQAQRKLTPFEAELEAVSTFTPPKGARLSSTVRIPSDTPSLTRFWTIPGGIDEVCRGAEASFRSWLAPEAHIDERWRPSLSCFFQAERGDQITELTIVPIASTPPEVQLGLKVARR